jgi:hypothetical protein
MAESLQGWSALLARQRFEAGNDVEQFLIDASLAQTMECPGKVLQQFVDVSVGTLHRRQRLDRIIRHHIVELPTIPRFAGLIVFRLFMTNTCSNID